MMRREGGGCWSASDESLSRSIRSVELTRAGEAFLVPDPAGVGDHRISLDAEHGLCAYLAVSFAALDAEAAGAVESSVGSGRESERSGTEMSEPVSSRVLARNEPSLRTQKKKELCTYPSVGYPCTG